MRNMKTVAIDITGPANGWAIISKTESIEYKIKHQYIKFGNSINNYRDTSQINFVYNSNKLKLFQKLIFII